ncbi:MAG: hypothetical protein ACYC3L_10925 [Gemmatimonadaceae bacterium]
MFKLLSGKLSLQVTAPTPFDEVFVIDSAFKRVAKGLGALTVDVDAGLYTVKFKSGDSAEEETLLVNERTVVVDRRVSRQPISVAAALRTRGALYERSLSSRLGVHTRRHSPGIQELASADAHGISRRGAQCTILVDVGADAASSIRLVSESGDDLPQPGWCGKAAAVVPGSYRLEVATGNAGSFSVSLPALAGWATRVWWPVAGRGRAPHDDPSGMRVVMTPVGRDDGGDAAEWVDKAMSGLLAERRAVPGDVLGDMTDAVRQNPMLLICCAHMLLLSPDVDAGDWDLFARIVGVLSELVPTHPDVRLLALYASKDSAVTSKRLTLGWPPMLWRTWRLVNTPFMRDRVVVAPDSVAFDAAQRAVTSAGWFMWRSTSRQSARNAGLTVSAVDRADPAVLIALPTATPEATSS